MTTARVLPSLWSRLGRLPAEADRLFDGWCEALSGGAVPPPVNLWEEAEAFRVEAELPGVPQDKVSVTVTNGTDLLLEGERPASGEGVAWHHRERGPGHFRRLLRLPTPVDADKVEARLVNGVLNLTLPKAESARARRVAVRGE
jgi:HSP20 family protein